MGQVELLTPRTEAEALASLAGASPGSIAVLAGGTDLLLDLDEGRLRPQRLLSLRRLPWREHRWDDRGLRVGATEPLRGIERDPELSRQFPALAQAIAAVGSPALRRQATFGGNLGRAAPASDLAPVMLVLDAEAELIGPNGPRGVPVDLLLRSSRSPALEPAELVRAVRFPERRPASAYLWQRVRPANDISQIGVAVAYSPSDRRWRLALGGVPPRAFLAREPAALLEGVEPTAEQVGRAATLLASSPSLVSDRRATGEQRRRLTELLCLCAVQRAAEAGKAVR